MTSNLPLADELAAVYARMSGLLLSEETVATAVRLVTSLAVDTMPGAAGSAVTLVDDQGRQVTRGATDDLAEKADTLQYELDEGPCLTAWTRRTVVRIEDTATSDRFPRWCAAVQPVGIRSVLSAPLVAADVALGALKVYSTRPTTFDDRSEHLLTMFAAQAAILLANVQTYERAQQLSDQLKDALRSRDLIGQAKGVLMEREGLDDNAAFSRLVVMSRNANRKLRDVARDVAGSAGRHSS